MGRMSHNAIVVSGTNFDGDGSFKSNDFWALRAEIAEMCRDDVPVSPVISSANGTRTFLVGPDGGKEGRDISDRGDELRAAVKAHLKALPPYTMIDWAEIQYGNDDCVTLIVDHSDKLAEDA